MLIFGFKTAITSLRARYVNSDSKTSRKLISFEKLNEFYTKVSKFQDKLHNFKKIQNAFENLYNVRFPKNKLVPKIISPRQHRTHYIHNRKHEFLAMIENQLKIYPIHIEKIYGINEMTKAIGSSKITIISWVKEFLKKKYGNISGEIHEEIWSSRCALARKVTYERIKNYIQKNGGVLITTKQEFNAMKEFPSERTVILKDKKRHIWKARARYLVHYNYWCPTCHEYKCEKSMRLIMQAIFGFKFPQTRLIDAPGIPIKKGGNLRFDGFNRNILENGRIYVVAFEYDGIQHDIFPNGYHKTELKFKRQQKNDNKKNSYSKGKNVVLIRLKAKDGFTFKRRIFFETEILRQFFKQTGVRLPFKNLRFDKNNSLCSFNALDKFLI
ncbi:hypothetical protein LCGC14_1097100 [marine sediment metagenome]|uniref:Uncharacterized protein n=1 Tax=marine sediment metagenome TaxID=412755 RepID=A0A0F9MAN6_9ZZZZ